MLNVSPKAGRVTTRLLGVVSVSIPPEQTKNPSPPEFGPLAKRAYSTPVYGGDEQPVSCCWSLST